MSYRTDNACIIREDIDYEYKEYFREILSKMDTFDLMSLYIDYFISERCLKHDFIVVDTAQANWDKGFPIPDKSINQLAIFYNHRQWKPMTFYQFISPDNIKQVDCGENWKERGRATRFHTTYCGIFHQLIITRNPTVPKVSPYASIKQPEITVRPTSNPLVMKQRKVSWYKYMWMKICSRAKEIITR